jgi:transcriptional regulator with GAF, ATPase, and Fis domain
MTSQASGPAAGRLAWLVGVGRLLWRDPAARCRAWVVCATVFVCAYAVGVLGYVLMTPELGIRCAFTPVVNHFYDEFLYPDDQPPLRQDDRIVEVGGGERIDDWPQLLRKMHLLRGERPAVVEGLNSEGLSYDPDSKGPPFVLIDGQRVVRVVYERPGVGKRVVWCRFGPAPLVTLVPSVLWFTLKIGLFVVGAIVLWRRPADRPAARFFWLCILSFGAYVGGFHWSRIVTQPLLLIVFMACAVFLPAVTLHFYLVFPRPKALLERHGRAALAVVYGPAAVFFGLLLSGYLWPRLWGIDWFSGFDGSGPPASDLRVLLTARGQIYTYFGVALLLYLFSLSCLVHSFRTAVNATERNQVKWILLGATAAVVPMGYSLYLAVWEKERFGGGAATWPMFAASACITTAYVVSITRYRLMQLDQLLSSGAVYFLMSSLAGVLYYGVVFAGLLLLGRRAGEAPSLFQVLGVCGTAMVLMMALDVVRARFRRALDRHLRREKVQVDRALQRLSQAVEQLVDPATLARRLLQTTADLLGAPGGAVYLRRGEPPLYALADGLGPPPPLTELPPGCPLVEALRQRPALAPAPADVSPAHRQLHFLGAAAAQALTHEGELLGLLVVAPRPASPYAPEEMQVLAAFAQLTALAVVSAEGHRTIEALNRELKDKVEKIAEQQRRILALQTQLMKREKPLPPEEAPAPAPAAERTEKARSSWEPPPPARSPQDSESEPKEGIVGSSSRMQQLLTLVKRVAASSSAVLLRGESGTGKELLARALHDNSPRAAKPFVKVHCAALSPGLMESELFGHVKGAFTTAIRDKVGRFESADGGTLFLDEIGDVSVEVQTKLLRVLEEMTFERVGSSEPVKVDVRIVAATHRSLEAMIGTGRFREDLFFRLNVLPIVAPPLRERIEDVPELIQHFLRLYNHRAGKAITGIDDDALVVLKGYSWPGNVRQLENVIERAVVIAEGPTITADDLPPEVFAAPGPGLAEVASGLSLPELAASLEAEQRERERREREGLVRALTAAKGNKAEAARALGVARSTLVSRLKKLGLG